MAKKDSGIMIVIGTKAELIKCMPIMRKLEERGQDYWFVSTGQHPLKDAAIDFGVKQPDYILSEEPEISTKFWSKINNNSIFWCFSMLPKIKRLVKNIQPRHVIYHGDTMSTAVAAMASSWPFNPFGKSWNNVHLEAGLRSGTLLAPFPEEISRQICDRFSDTLFAVSDFSEGHLKRARWKGIFGKIYNTGNTVVDAANIIFEGAKEKTKIRKLPKKFALINVHRHEHITREKEMRKIVDIIKSIRYDAIWPLHDNTRKYLEDYGMMRELESMKNLKIMPLVDYWTFMYLMGKCSYLVTDGGSIQEESLVFKKPCVILRHVTERQEGLSTNINFLTKLNVARTRKLIRRIENEGIDVEDFVNPYGGFGAAERVLEVLG
jgi:UDP-N-acetylglucosamine 2-epimerase (non-hydrolysing)